MTKKSIELGLAPDGGPVYLPEELRATHMHVVGASGRGKSKFLAHLIQQDIKEKRGLCLIDPHGQLVEEIIAWCATHGLDRGRKIRIIEPADPHRSFGFNPLSFGSDTVVSVAVDFLAKAFAQVWGGEDTTKMPLLRRVLRNVLYVLAVRKLTLLEAPYLLATDDTDNVRKHLTENLPDSVFQAEWDEFNNLNRRDRTEQFLSTRNRMIEFLSDELIRAIVGQRQDLIDFRRCMDEGDIVLVNLAGQGRLSPDSARLIGTLMVNDLFFKARGRPKGSRPFYLYIDECYDFLNEDIERILDQCRKFGLHLILSHQRLGQLRREGEHIYNAVMGGAQTKIIFGGLEAEDAELMAKNVFLGELNLEEPKHILDKPTVVGYDYIWLKNEGSGEGYALATTSGEAVNWSEVASYLITDSPDWENPVEAEGLATSSGGSVISSETETRSWQTQNGRAQALHPLLELKPTQTYSLEDQIHRAVAALVNQRERHSVVKVPCILSGRLVVPEVREGYLKAEHVAEWQTRILDETEFLKVTSVVLEELEQRRERLRLQALTPEEKDPEDWFSNP